MITPKQLVELEDIIAHFGEIPQLVKSAEEAGEYLTAITRYLALKDTDGSLREHAIEECADALITLMQARIILGKDQVDDVIDYKIRRTIDRIKTENKLK